MLPALGAALAWATVKPVGGDETLTVQNLYAKMNNGIHFWTQPKLPNVHIVRLTNIDSSFAHFWTRI